MRGGTDYTVRLSTVAVLPSNSILGGGGGVGTVSLYFEVLRDAVASRNGEGSCPSGRMFRCDYSGYVSLGRCGEKSFVLQC